MKVLAGAVLFFGAPIAAGIVLIATVRYLAEVWEMGDGPVLGIMAGTAFVLYLAWKVLDKAEA